MWFEGLTGFSEESPSQVRSNIEVDGVRLRSRVNGKTFTCGTLETPTLGELQHRALSGGQTVGKTTVREIVADVQQLHADPANAGALFQVASQFNLLEMVSPSVTPEKGVAIYEHDRTQGPACAIAAGASTICRNYFAEVNGEVGQTAENQIDCLADIGTALGNDSRDLWKMRNGYALATRDGLFEITSGLRGSSEEQIDGLRRLLRIGMQWNTQVTLQGASHTVSQAYCSALPVAYSGHPSDEWEMFARLVLEASYEATFCAAIINAVKTGSNKVFLTLLGGGAFGNEIDWIIGAIHRALAIHKDSGLNVGIVSYGSSQYHVKQLINRINLR